MSNLSEVLIIWSQSQLLSICASDANKEIWNVCDRLHIPDRIGGEALVTNFTHNWHQYNSSSLRKNLYANPLNFDFDEYSHMQVQNSTKLQD